MSFKETMDEALKFKIGDKVISLPYVEALRTELSVNGPHEAEKFYKGPRINAPAPEIIIERMIVECHGGVQFFYRTRAWLSDGKQTLKESTELEIVSYDEAVLALMNLKAKIEEEKSE